VTSTGGLGAVRSRAGFERTVALLDWLLAQKPNDRALSGLIDWVSGLLADYEADTLPAVSATPLDVLRHLMNDNGLKQQDLADVFGGQSVVSAVLAGKRAINARQAALLASRFGVSASAFIALPGEPAVMPVSARSARATKARTTKVVTAAGADRSSRRPSLTR
jgi:HTH-type transcriptional regulator/antitoxin HigA